MTNPWVSALLGIGVGLMSQFLPTGFPKWVRDAGFWLGLALVVWAVLLAAYKAGLAKHLVVWWRFVSQLRIVRVECSRVLGQYAPAEPVLTSTPVAVGIFDPTAKPLLPQPLSPREIDEVLETSKLVIELLNETDDAIAFTHEIKNKAVAFPTNRDIIEVHIFDLQRCINTVAAVGRQAERLFRQYPQRADIMKTMIACHANSVVRAIEHLRKAVHLLSRLALAAPQKTDVSEYTYLLHPFVAALDKELRELSSWKGRTSDHVLSIRKGLRP